jgi:DNA repair exonuclease SbcCD ATPase subunit
MSKSYLDSRDLQERLDELEAKEQAISDAQEALDGLRKDGSDEDEIEAAQDDVDSAENDFDADERKELEELRSLSEEVGSEWRHGVTLIPESEFEDYCQELVSDIGDLPRDLPGYIVIDWGATANNLRADYSSTTYQGEDYLYRAG